MRNGGAILFLALTIYIQYSSTLESGTDVSATVEPTTEAITTTTEDDFFKSIDEESFELDTTTTTSTTSVPVTSTAATISAEETSNGTQVPDLKIGYQMADKLSDQVRLFLKHFQQKDPIGIPGAILPDPMILPDLHRSIGFGSVTFKNIKLYELSQFRLSHINTDLEKMQVYVEIEMKRLVSLGNYSMKSWVNKASGPFNITMLNVIAEGAAALERDENGQLEATESQMDMTCEKFIMDLKGSGMASIVDGMGPFVFESIKPFLLRKINTDIRTDINKQIKKFTAKIPQNMSPLDLGIYEARKYVRKNRYDPYHLVNISYNVNFIRFNVSDFWLLGLSNFNRVGDLSLSMDKGVIQFGVHVITSKLSGQCRWSASLRNRDAVFQAGLLTFSVDYLQVQISVNQSMNIQNKPKLNDLDLQLGKIHVKHVGLDQLDFIINSVANHIPKLLHILILDTIEEPLKVKIQEVLNNSLVGDYSIDNILNKKILPKLDEFVSQYNENKTYDKVQYDTTPSFERIMSSTESVTSTKTVTQETTTGAAPTGEDATTAQSTATVDDIDANVL